MATTKTQDPPIIGNLQGRELLALMRSFYSDPKNQAAYKAWMDKKEKEKRA